MTHLESKSKQNYLYFVPITTRWMDNDVYGHVNNVVYYSYFDTAANHYLIEHAGLDFQAGKIIGFVVSSACQYYRPIAFPATIEVGVRVNRLGTSSVEYGLAIFERDRAEASASGVFTHVFVERETGKSTAMPEQIREALTKIQTLN